MHQDQATAQYRALRQEYIDGSAAVCECPVCGAGDMTAAFPHIARIGGQIYEPSGDAYQQCAGCGTIMIDRIFPAGYYDRLLNEFYGVVPWFIDRLAERKAALRSRLIRDAATDFGIGVRRILEVSSYDGTTLDRLRRDFEAVAFGVEPTVAAVDYAERAFPTLAGTMHRSQFEDAGDFLEPLGPFDAVVISAAFRQMSRPLAAVELLRQCVAQGGLLMINEGGFLDDALTMEKEAAITWSVHCAEKCFLYSRNSLIALLERAGFTYLRGASYERAFDEREIPFHALLFRHDGNARQVESRLDLARTVGLAAAKIIRDRTAPSPDALLKNIWAGVQSVR